MNSKGHGKYLSRTEHKLLLNGWKDGEFNSSYTKELRTGGRNLNEVIFETANNFLKFVVVS